MSKIPNTKKAKYNKDDKFGWVDSQWEKFMEEQKVLKEKIAELEERCIRDDNYIEDLEREKAAYIDMNNHLKSQLKAIEGAKVGKVNHKEKYKKLLRDNKALLDWANSFRTSQELHNINLINRRMAKKPKVVK